MINFIPDEEIRNDLEILNGAPDVQTKREIGAKYGLSPKECTQWKHVAQKIYEYLRTVRNQKTDFTKQDVSDFYHLTDDAQKYDKIYPFLLLESRAFIEYLLNHIYAYLSVKGVKQYTLDHIDTVRLTRDIYGSAANLFHLERYKSIKKYYDEHYGHKQSQAQSNNKLSIELQGLFIEETYEQRMQLEQILENFINECYDTYVYGSSEYIKIYKLMNSYTEERDKLSGGKYRPRLHEQVPPEVIKLNEYINELHLLLYTYRYFSPDCSATTHITKEDRIEKSIEYFNKVFDKALNKSVINKIISSNDLTNINDIKISELQKSDFGYYFIISYNDNKIYLNFGLQHENQNIDNMDDLVKNSRHVQHLNYATLIYEIKVTSKLYKKKINESFNFNSLNENEIHLNIDDFNFNDENHNADSNIIDDEDVIKTHIDFWNQFVDLGLPSGTLWCKYNFGSNIEKTKYNDWFGDYVQWGDIIPNTVKKTGYSYVWTTYKYSRGASNMIKKYVTNTDYSAKNPDNNYHPYLDNLTNLLPEDDIATQQLGEYFHIPTKEQYDELLKNTETSWKINYQGVRWLDGRIFKSKINGNEIFFPAAGVRQNLNLNGSGDIGEYWTSSLDEACNSLAHVFHFKDGSYFIGTDPRSLGHNIRPVFNKQ